MQNKPNFDKGQNKPNPLYKKDLRKFFTPSDNEKRTQNEPNFKIDKMNLNFYLTKDYKNVPLRRRGENKPNTNPTCRGVASGEAGSNPIFTKNPEKLALILLSNDKRF